MKIKSAELVYWNSIKIINDENIDANSIEFLVNDEHVDLFQTGNDIFSFNFEGELLGKDLKIRIGEDILTVSVMNAPNFDNFDGCYGYFEDDLGATYSKDSTEFVLWAPLAKKVFVRIGENKYEMERFEHGIYRVAVLGDFDGALYDYVILLDDKEIISIDPYGKSSNANAEKSAVINFEKVKSDSCKECLPEFKEYCEAIIYEGHIRDLTISNATNIVNKGKYLGLTEAGRISPKNNPVGLDYIKNLGVTHLQLLPVLDFGSVDEIKLDKYNWGYDPMQFFTLEGSYSINPNDPYSRIVEFKKLVSSLHQNGIRVNLDVVYNHVYKTKEFSLNKITPNYFFRVEGAKAANHSGCGNDFASERIMARKIIVDSVLYLLNEFDVDGFRFDLMGLIDVDTMNEITAKVRQIKPNAMIYGEGWDMCCSSRYSDKFANMKNASLMPDIAHFNDSYRNILRGLGGKAELDKPGYLMGNKDFDEGFKFAFFGGTKDEVFPRLFTSYNQTVNYVECHDNATIYDMISASTNVDDKMRLVKLFNKVLLLTPGITFIHMGQEFGQTKRFNANTYNLPDIYNAFDPNLMDQRMDLVESLINNIAVRKSIDLYKIGDPNIVNKLITIKTVSPVFEAVMNDTKGIFHIFVNKNENHEKLNDLEYSRMVPYSPFKIGLDSEIINAQKIGIAQRKCSIYKEL